MAGLVVLIPVAILGGACMGAFLRISAAIRWEDRRRGSLRRNAPDRSAETARALVGVNGSRWD